MSLYTSKSPLWAIMYKNLCIAALGGTLFGCALFPVLSAIKHTLHKANYYRFDPVQLLSFILQSPILIIYALPLLIPLFIIAFLVTFTFQKSIRKHLVVWCLLAPFSVWLTTIIFLTHRAANSFDAKFNWWERILINLSESDHFLFLIAPAFSSLVFYRLCSKSFSRTAEEIK